MFTQGDNIAIFKRQNRRTIKQLGVKCVIFKHGHQNHKILKFKRIKNAI
jgi:hypothetical protein